MIDFGYSKDYKDNSIFNMLYGKFCENAYHTQCEAHAPSNSTLSLKTFKDERGQCVSMFL